MGCLFNELNIELVFEKGLLPKKPLWAESGDGCAEVIMWCFEVSMCWPFFLA